MLALLLLSGAHFYLNTDHAQRVIQDRVNAAIPGSVGWQEADISIFGGRIAVTGAVVSGTEGGTIIDAGRLFADVSMIDLLRGSLVLVAEIENPRVMLVRDTDGGFNIVRAFADPEKTRIHPEEEEKRKIASPFSMNVVLQSAEVSEGFFEFTDYAATGEGVPGRIALENIHVGIDNANLAEKSGRGSVRIKSGIFDMGNIRVPLTRFVFEAVMDKGQLRPVTADIRLAGENGAPRLTFAGGAENVFDAPEMDFELSAAAELSHIRDMFSLDMPLSGRAEFDVAASGNPADPSVRVGARYGGGNVAGVELEEIDLQSEMADLSVDISRLAARIRGAEADLAGTVDLRNAFENGLLAAPTDLDAISYKLMVNNGSVDFGQLPWTRAFMSGTARGSAGITGAGIFPRSLSAKVDAAVTGSGVTAGDILAPVDAEIHLKARMNDGKVFADPVQVALRETHLTVTGRYDIFENTVDAAATLETPDLAQALAPLGVDLFSGETILDATVSGPVLQPAIKADIESKKLGYGDVRIGDTILEAALDASGRAVIEKLVVDNRGSKLDISGHVDLFEGGFAGFRKEMPAGVTAVARQVELTDFFPFLDISGEINGKFRLAEKIMDPVLSVSMKHAGLGYKDIHAGDLETEMRLSEGTLTIDALRLKNNRSEVALDGRADLLFPGSLSPLPEPEIDIVFAESTLFINDFIDTAAGEIRFDGHAKGKLTELAASLSLSGEGIEAADHVIGDVTARLGFAHGRLNFDSLEIVNSRSGVSVAGGIQLFRPATLEMHPDPEMDMEIRGDSIYLSDFIPGARGELSVTARMTGSLKDPAGKAEISGDMIDTGVQRIDSIRVASLFEDKTIFFDSVDITLAPGESVRAGGYVSLDGRFGLEIASDEIAVSRIDALAETGLSGMMTIAASGAGTIHDPEVQGDFRLRDLRAGSEELSPLDVEFAIKDRIATVAASSAFSGSAVYHIDTGDFGARGNFDDTQLDPFFRIAGMPGVFGNFSATVLADGNAAALSEITAEMNIESMTLFQTRGNAEPFELIRVTGLSADFRDGRFDIPENEIALPGTSRLVISGRGDLTGDLELIARGDVPMPVVTAFVPHIEDPEGGIGFSGTITRSAGREEIDAEIRLSDIGFTISELMQELHQVNGRIRITGSAVEMDGLSGRLDTGRFSANGRLRMEEGFQPGEASLHVNAHALPIRVPGTIELVVNSEMSFTGVPDDSRLSGEVMLLEGLYYKDVEINLLEEVTRRRRAAQPRAEPPDFDLPYVKNLDLDIDIGYRKPLMVDNNLALMTLRPEIRINGTLSQPQVTGRAEIAQGTVSYQRIEFEIERGVIDFIDPYRIQPDIDILARSRVRRWIIDLEISGTPRELDFSLSSNPPEEHADILSLLVLGRTTSELTEGTGPAGPSPEEMLVKMLAGRMEEDIRAGTGLDIFEVDYARDETDRETEQSLRLTVGKELSRRLAVTYSVERKSGETVQQQTAIYKMLEFLSMSAFQDTAGAFGGEMRFRLEFR